MAGGNPAKGSGPHASSSFAGLQTRLRRERLAPPHASIAQTLLREDFPHTLRDEDEPADPSRIRRIGEEFEIDEELAAMGTIAIGEGGRALQTFSGGRSSEVALVPCAKSHRLLHVQGATAEAFVISQQVAHPVVAIVMEGIRVAWPGGEIRPDAMLVMATGGITVREVKRDENDLRNPEKRRSIAMGAEILRRGGIQYDIVYRRDIFSNERHRRNATLFASRGFAHVSRSQVDALDSLLAKRGPQIAWGDLVDALEEDGRLRAEAAAQALVVRRRVEIDLDQRLRDDVEVVVHPPATVH